MSSIVAERVLDVRHWTDTQFTLSTTRRAGLRFENGQFVMVGMEIDQRPLLRAGIARLPCLSHPSPAFTAAPAFHRRAPVTEGAQPG